MPRVAKPAVNRRAFLQTTVLAGIAGLTLPTLLAARAQAKAANPTLGDTAVIQVWLGGGLRIRQVIGSSTAKGEVPKERPLRSYDVLATMYRHMGIRPSSTTPVAPCRSCTKTR